jgi:hypothetical protein
LLLLEEQVKKDETSGEHNAFGENEKCLQDFGKKAKREEATRKT